MYDALKRKEREQQLGYPTRARRVVEFALASVSDLGIGQAARLYGVIGRDVGWPNDA